MPGTISPSTHLCFSACFEFPRARDLSIRNSGHDRGCDRMGGITWLRRVRYAGASGGGGGGD